MKRIALATMTAFLAVTMPVWGSESESTGKAAFDRHCVHCHGPSNEATGTLQLARTRGQDKALLTERDDLRPLYIQYVVRHGLKAMPAFVPSDLTDAQLEALADYLTR